ncbi:hypothetical protein ES703_88980 [subsurface metagenome]
METDSIVLVIEKLVFAGVKEKLFTGVSTRLVSRITPILSISSASIIRPNFCCCDVSMSSASIITVPTKSSRSRI